MSNVGLSRVLSISAIVLGLLSDIGRSLLNVLLCSRSIVTGLSAQIGSLGLHILKGGTGGRGSFLGQVGESVLGGTGVGGSLIRELLACRLAVT